MRDAFAAQPALAATLVEPDPGQVVAPLAAPGLTGRCASGLDLILEGFLLHHGRPRHLMVDDGKRILAGDYCYAHGLVHVAQAGDLAVIALLADLVALSASLVATDDHASLPALWRTTVAVIAHPEDLAQEAALAAAKESLRAGDVEPLRVLGANLPSTPELDEALSHA